MRVTDEVAFIVGERRHTLINDYIAPERERNSTYQVTTARLSVRP
jgi:hypothetical protein